MKLKSLQEVIEASAAILEFLQDEDRKAAVDETSDYFHSSALTDAALKQREALRFVVMARRAEAKIAARLDNSELT